jgi:hypothetical protein
MSDRHVVRANVDYSVHRKELGAYAYISHLACLRCPTDRPFVARRADARRGGERSGLASYNRMRAKVVAHVFDAHRDAVAAAADQAQDAADGDD